MHKPAYDANFYSVKSSGSISSAQEILPLVKRYINPASVVDVGCGTGTWLKVWRDLGIENLLGIDGDYVSRDQLLIPQDRFLPMNLATPAPLDQQFDLVESLEVAEHLPPSAAEAFISFLCSLGPVVLFSAAIPYQGGTNHVNEQWPAYWADYFSRHGYLPFDVIRDPVWDNRKVDWWYAQNTLLFVKTTKLTSLPDLSRLTPAGLQSLSRVHPRKWHVKNEQPVPLEKLVPMIPVSALLFAKTYYHQVKQKLHRPRK
jgi:SAM-dependent methyltransferase